MTVMTSKGQVTIPKRVRDRLGLKAGAEVEFIERENGEVVLTAAVSQPDRVPYDEALDRVTGILKLGMTTAEYMAWVRGDDSAP